MSWRGCRLRKTHCSNLGADALHAAIKDYWVKIGKIKPEEMKEESHEGETCPDGLRAGPVKSYSK